MSFKKQIGRRINFWTRARVASTVLALGLVLIAASSCSQTNEVATNTTQTQNNGASAPANTGQNKAAPAQMTAAERLKAASTMPFAPGVLETEIQGVDGQAFHLADYKGKVVVLDLWATWCGPCRIEIPHLNAIKKQYADQGVEVIGLTNEDPTDDAETVREFARDMKINYKLGWASATLWRSLGRAQSIPQTYVIGRDGRPVRFFAGFTPQSLPDGASDHIATPARVERAIDEALNAQASDD